MNRLNRVVQKELLLGILRQVAGSPRHDPGLPDHRPHKGKGGQLHPAPVEEGGLLRRGQGQDHQAVHAEQVQDKGIDDQHPQAEHRAVFVVVPGDVRDGDQHHDDRVKDHRLLDHFKILVHDLPPVGPWTAAPAPSFAPILPQGGPGL